ncbi:hypothetical protein PLEI_0218 [Photobacterium leiognathi lrivu.4.1]|uniref:Uncharacterized protein n=1 Tax=Photobacterium leiognathi lrivu.4.1 TaxID=1248232 RepID=V5F6W3_PHOLE|nr:hypothetical protein [Photobacterium leiognathi]GAD28577.1 hypothetical protein PLEI_0218 [Photobacterium leiognathi lrivu.4.1]
MNWLILLPGAFPSASVLAQPHWTAQAAQQTEQTEQTEQTKAAQGSAFDKAKRYQAAIKAQEQTALNRLLPKENNGTRSPVIILASLACRKLHYKLCYIRPASIRFGSVANSCSDVTESLKYTGISHS